MSNQAKSMLDKDEHWFAQVMTDINKVHWHTIGEAEHNGERGVYLIMFYGEKYIYSMQYFYEIEHPHIWCIAFDPVTNDSDFFTISTDKASEVIVSLEDKIGKVLV